MSSSIGFLAYVFSKENSDEVLTLRKNHAEKHLEKINRGALVRTEVGDGGSGFVAWSLQNSTMKWEPYLRRGDAGVAWLHVPSVAGGPDSGVDEWELADAVLGGRVGADEIGAPFAVARWHRGQLEIVNDMLGLVRLFHFRFEGGDVWTTRPGLAHVFMGEVPKKNQLAWSGMATLGWATSGSTQLGEGRQLPGGTRVAGSLHAGRRSLDVQNVFANWLYDARMSDEPAPETSVRDMELYMSTAKRWPRKAISDLSGGKDSRVVAAIGIRTGAIESVRTIATDHGEVETAQHLMSLIDTDVTHLVVPRKDPSRPGGSFVDRVSSQHTAWEGRYLSTTAYNSAKFQGFGPAGAPTFNGLGGEVMAGGNLLGAWYDRLIDAPGDAAVGKLATMANVGLGVSAEAKEIVASDIKQYVPRAADMGITSAAGVMDIFYHLDKMPNWSIPYATPNIITPLFAPSLLKFAAQRTGAPMEYGEAHRRLLREAIPSWADVPFYKPSAKKRAVQFIWEHGDWAEIRAFVAERSESLETFDTEITSAVLTSVENGDAAKREEIFIQRLIWEATFDGYLVELASEARSTAAAISRSLR